MPNEGLGPRYLCINFCNFLITRSRVIPGWDPKAAGKFLVNVTLTDLSETYSLGRG